jgi:hypothetical protein
VGVHNTFFATSTARERERERERERASERERERENIKTQNTDKQLASATPQHPKKRKP